MADIVNEKDSNKTNDRLFSYDKIDNKELVNSIMNVEMNIKFYKETKKHCEKCPSKNKCWQDCPYYIPSMIHLEVMEEKRDELWKEHKTRKENIMVR